MRFGSTFLSYAPAPYWRIETQTGTGQASRSLLPARIMSAFKEGDPTTLNRMYGRSIGKPLRGRQQGLVDDLLPKITVPAEGPVTAKNLFSEDCPLHFEIGFGSGEHLAYRADMLPNHGFIGAEPFLNGVAAALGHVDDEKLANIRLHHGDAIDVLQRLPDGALTMCYLLHPDPWPKNKHAKRRMVNDGPISLIAQKMKPGGEFRFGTDHDVYLRHALMVMQRHTDKFEWVVEGPSNWQNRPSGWCETRYEYKARNTFGHEVWYFRFRRI